MKNKQFFVKLIANEGTNELLKDGKAFLLLTQIALRARRKDGIVECNGIQFWFQWPYEISDFKGRLFPADSGVDLLCNSIAPVPPSFIHGQKGRYTWRTELKKPIPECPEWLKRLILESTAKPNDQKNIFAGQLKTLTDLSSCQLKRVNYWFDTAIKSDHPNRDEFRFVLCCKRFGLDDQSIIPMLEQMPKARKRNQDYIYRTLRNAEHIIG
ncbi:MAG: hypothetical protein JW913_02050 [Chitinispirillaceae bacterium]|nr:hypothetical protein [Chitinispirillaceae bacterium]